MHGVGYHYHDHGWAIDDEHLYDDGSLHHDDDGSASRLSQLTPR